MSSLARLEFKLLIPIVLVHKMLLMSRGTEGHRVPEAKIRELKHATFLSHGPTLEVYCFPSLLVFTLPYLYFKSICASRDDYFENLGETNVLACKMFTSGCRPWLKNVACLSSLMPESGYCTRCNSTCLGLVRLSVMRVQRTSTKFEGNSTGKEKGKERNFI